LNIPETHRQHRLRVLFASLLAFSAPVLHAADPDELAFRELYRELVEINTTLSEGSCTAAAAAMAARLSAGGLPDDAIHVLVPPGRPKDGNLVATLAGREPALAPILLLAHIDVVEAKREDWERDPFKLVEEDGYFYARGASDDKAMAAVFTDTLIRLRRAGHVPRRTITLALTCGEETSSVHNGVAWLLESRPDLLRAEFALNEGATGLLDASGRPVSLDIQAGEKVYQDFRLETTNVGGHSARPVRANAINQLATALVRIADFQFPIELNGTTRAYFEQQAAMAPPEVAADIRAVLADPRATVAAERLWARNPNWNGMLRTTCVSTMIQGGHAQNALPQRAHAIVNCRILPGTTIEAVLGKLVSLVADEGVTISIDGDRGITAPVPALIPKILGPAQRVAAGLWPGVPLVPILTPGATDGRFLNAAGIPTYGLSGMFQDAQGSRAHGLNERIRVKSLLDGRTFLHEVVRLYADSPD
jgi:acetylornithine deacetylase/succinyl-diaminopimelate desuccinylase-like protein